MRDNGMYDNIKDLKGLKERLNERRTNFRDLVNAKTKEQTIKKSERKKYNQEMYLDCINTIGADSFLIGNFINVLPLGKLNHLSSVTVIEDSVIDDILKSIFDIQNSDYVNKKHKSSTGLSFIDIDDKYDTRTCNDEVFKTILKSLSAQERDKSRSFNYREIGYSSEKLDPLFSSKKELSFNDHELSLKCNFFFNKKEKYFIEELMRSYRERKVFPIINREMKPFICYLSLSNSENEIVFFVVATRHRLNCYVYSFGEGGSTVIGDDIYDLKRHVLNELFRAIGNKDKDHISDIKEVFSNIVPITVLPLINHRNIFLCEKRKVKEIIRNEVYIYYGDTLPYHDFFKKSIKVHAINRIRQIATDSYYLLRDGAGEENVFAKVCENIKELLQLAHQYFAGEIGTFTNKVFINQLAVTLDTITLYYLLQSMEVACRVSRENDDDFNDENERLEFITKTCVKRFEEIYHNHKEEFSCKPKEIEFRANLLSSASRFYNFVYNLYIVEHGCVDNIEKALSRNLLSISRRIFGE